MHRILGGYPPSGFLNLGGGNSSPIRLRNEVKMQKVVEELRQRVPEKKDADVRYFIADASASGLDYAKIVQPLKDLHITLVYHNVGGSDTSGLRYVRPVQPLER